MTENIDDICKTTKATYPYIARRILLKLSGESLLGATSYGIDTETLQRIACEIIELHNSGLEIAIVVGGGNIFRGVNGIEQGIDRVTSDHMGMLATVMNALALQNAIESMKVESRVMSAVPMSSICEPYIRRRALHHLQKNRIVICAAGTGHPFFTTDSAAVLRASEMKCDILLKGTKVDGVYSADPFKNPDAIHYKTLTYDQILREKLNVMDMSAVGLARDNNLPLSVFSVTTPGSLINVLKGAGHSTLIHDSQEG